MIIDENAVIQLNGVINRLLGRAPSPVGSQEADRPLIDVSRPNIHDTKSEFQAELRAVETVCDRLDQILRELLAENAAKDGQHGQMIARLETAIDRDAVGDVKSRKKPATAADLIVLSIYRSGFFDSTRRVLIEMKSIYERRLAELRSQEKLFWAVKNRPPNYFARTIALRLAKLYARETLKRPTYGFSSDVNAPSTDFGRALEDVFSILGIKASTRNAAPWAIEQITDEALNAIRNSRSGIIELGAMGARKVENPPQKG